MAIALQKPSTYFIPHIRVLPYILQQAVGGGTPRDAGDVHVQWTNETQTATSLVVRHKRQLFDSGH